jgi:hypothetical protein
LSTLAGAHANIARAAPEGKGPPMSSLDINPKAWIRAEARGHFRKLPRVGTSATDFRARASTSRREAIF